MTKIESDTRFDTVLADLSEDDAWTLLHKMAARFDWATAVWAMGDIEVTDEGLTYGDTDVELHPAERDAVANTWEWRRGIADTAGEQISDRGLIPSIIRHYNEESEQIGFTLQTFDGSTRYDMDGNPQG